jgi:hypothetical protein
MGELGKKLLVFVLGNLAVYGTIHAVKNAMHGKDILGRPKKEQERTRMDWMGNVVLGTGDYKVV